MEIAANWKINFPLYIKHIDTCTDVRGPTASSNVQIIETFQKNLLRTTLDRYWYILDSDIQPNIPIHSVRKIPRDPVLNIFKRLTKHPTF